MDLRMECLQERLGGVRALTEVFSDATGDVVENAVSAANSLASLDRCSDVPLLRAVVRPPDNPASRTKIALVRKELAELKAGFDAGRWKEATKRTTELVAEARALGYAPLVAEILSLVGRIYGRANEIEAAEKAMVEAYWAADTSRHDEIRAESATNLVFVVGYQQGHFDDAERWATAANSVLRRLGGHELLQGWLLNDLGCVHDLRGDKEGAVRLMLEGLDLKIKALGRDHPDVGFSEANVGMSLQGLQRSSEALEHLNRAVVLVERGLGNGHPELAMVISNRSEILNALGRYAEARGGFEKARVIWERELGADNLNLGYALTGIGLSYLGEKNPNAALVPLERAFRIREAQELEPSRRAETRFALARALWDSRRDRGRSTTLAADASSTYAKAGAVGKASEIDSWLREHSAVERIALRSSP
jgi:tetratricopeptide (TPR) repeat protein